jgi:hypothetical protein
VRACLIVGDHQPPKPCPPPPLLAPRSDYGGRTAFSGRAATVKCFENNPLVRASLEEKGDGRVLVVDGGASMRCALLGDNIAAMAVENGWSVSAVAWGEGDGEGGNRRRRCFIKPPPPSPSPPLC